MTDQKLIAGPKGAVANDLPTARRPMIVALLVTVIGLGGFFGWAALAPLASGALLQGRVAGETAHQVVQHLDGGIITDILVKDGQKVSKGQVLFRVSTAEDKVKRNALEQRRRNLMLREARLLAHRDGNGQFEIPPEVQAHAAEPETAEMIASQRRLFRNERDALTGQLAVLDKRIEQLEANIESLELRAKARDRELELVAGQVKDVRYLVKQGIATKKRLTDLRRQKASLEDAKEAVLGQISQSQQAIAGAEAQKGSLTDRMRREWADELAKVKQERVQVEFDLAGIRDKLARHDVRAPRAGIVMNMRYVTEGGVVAPGAPLLDIVPTGDLLVVDARIQPTDIDRVRVGEGARVRLTALPTQTTPVLDGTVIEVSPDTVKDKDGTDRYYKAQIQIDSRDLAAIGGTDRLYPGMPAEVVVVAEHSSLLRELLKPLTQSLFRAFRS